MKVRSIALLAAASVLTFLNQASAQVDFTPDAQRIISDPMYLPLTGQRSVNGFNVEGRPPAKPGEEPGGDMRAVTPGYFRAMGIPLESGRVFTTADRNGTRDVAIVSATLARTLFPNENPIGHILVYEWDRITHAEIVGVVGDVHHDGPAAQAYMEIYRPLSQFIYSGMDIVVRVNGDPATFVKPDCVR